MFDIMLSDTDISITGINIAFIKLPINVIKNSIIGCNKLADVMFPSCNH